jgi:glucose-6-phosphate dehydrogenase assembly protein OpcA
MAAAVSTGAAAPPAREEATWFDSDVKVADVVAQLGALRAKAMRSTGPVAVSGVLNLVAITPSDEELPEVEHTIADLAEHQPSRAVVVSPGDPHDDPGIDANVSVSCTFGEGEHRVCVEQVTLTMRGGALAGAASAVEPLLRNDLPTFLWWPAPPEVESDTLDRLRELAQRVITEGARSREPEVALRALGARIEQGRPHLTDLSWAALTPWRQLIVQLLGPNEIERLRSSPAVVHIASPGTQPSLAAHLLAGWLRGGLGDRALVEHEPRPRGAEGVLAVELESASGRRLAVERVEGRGTAAVTVTSPGSRPRRRTLPLPIPHRSVLLAGELEYLERDVAFEHAVTRALELIA